MSKAREIAETRYAKGEITEEEFCTIVDSLEKSTANQNINLTAPASSDTEHGKVKQAESEVPSKQRKAESTPEMLQHYQRANFMSDLTLPAKVIDKTVNFIYVMYFVQMIFLYKIMDNTSQFNDWFKVFSASSDITDPFAALISFVLIIPELVVAIAGLVWIYRASKNLFFFRISALKASPGWSIGWFFVPIAFFWMPIKVAHQIYAGSKYGNDWKNSSINGQLILWWLLFWFAGWVVAYFIPTEITSIDKTTQALVIYGIYLAVSAASLSIFSNILVKETTERQVALFSETSNHKNS